MEIALRVVQFWCEIKLVLTNCTPASRSCNFVITRLISHQIALHSVQLPLLINAHFFVIRKTLSSKKDESSHDKPVAKIKRAKTAPDFAKLHKNWEANFAKVSEIKHVKCIASAGICILY